MYRTIGYPDLLMLWKKGARNGSIRRLSSLKKGLFRCALEYCRRLGPISNPRLVGMIEGIADRIRNTVGQRIWRRGLDLAHQWLGGKVASIFPQVRRWLCEDPFLFWLGTDAMVNHRRWVMVQKK
ncbi:MAG: hypothetical protein H5T33_05915 [Candidatus Methanosuratus sp.]|nr:hypothetical protein [Candidatus Methanosuratincola sp.]